MKKTLSFVTAAICLFIFAGCDGPLNDKELEKDLGRLSSITSNRERIPGVGLHFKEEGETYPFSLIKKEKTDDGYLFVFEHEETIITDPVAGELFIIPRYTSSTIYNENNTVEPILTSYSFSNWGGKWLRPRRPLLMRFPAVFSRLILFPENMRNLFSLKIL